jgi:hypothetical protein
MGIIGSLRHVDNTSERREHQDENALEFSRQWIGKHWRVSSKPLARRTLRVQMSSAFVVTQG